MSLAHALTSELRNDPASLIDMQGALDIDSVWQSCLRLIGQVLPYSACSLFFDIDDMQPRRARHHVVHPAAPAFEPATSLTVVGPYLAAHPQSRFYTFADVAELDPGAAGRWQAQESERCWDEFAQLAFWREGRLEAVLGVGWDSRQTRVTQTDLSFLERLHPLIEAGLSRLHALQSERMRREGLELALEQMPLAVMMIGLDGQLLFSNEAARRQCMVWNNGLDVRSRALRLPDGIDEMLEAASAVDGAPADGGDHETHRVAHPLLAQLSATVSLRWDSAGLNRLPCYVVVFDEPHPVRDGTPINQRAMLLQKLSPKERRVGLMVAEGMRNEEIAQRLCRSRRTIEFQVASIYRKLEVGGRGQLIRLLG